MKCLGNSQWAHGGNGRWLAVLVVAALLPVGACDCSSHHAAIFIVSPMDGDNITTGKDVDNNPANGIQIDVTANTSRISQGTQLQLQVGSGGTFTTVATAMVTSSENVTFTNVTLSMGQQDLRVCTNDACSTSSQVVSVMVEPVPVCPDLTFVTPAPPAMGGDLTLGPGDNDAGTGCTGTFEKTFTVATGATPAGTQLALLENGTQRATATVAGGTATFPNVVLDNRNTTPNTIKVTFNYQGVACQALYPTNVLVDCQGVSCSITSPVAQNGYLNQSNDSSSNPGLQATFEVSTDAEAVGQPVNLYVDGSLSPEGGTATATAQGAGAIADIAANLSEGPHTIRAECRDAAGNITTTQVNWTVDLTPCDLSITSIDTAQTSFTDFTTPPILVPADDVDTSTPQVDVTLTGSSSPNQCAQLRAAPCSSIDSATYAPLSSSTYSNNVTLSSSANQDLCVQGEDTAGNVTNAQVSVIFNSQQPQLQIATPVTGSRFNRDGGTYTNGAGSTVPYIQDLDTSTINCDASFQVLCSQLGTVQLFRNDPTLGRVALTTDGTTPATAQCTSAMGLPTGYIGTATFSNVRLPRTSPPGDPMEVIAVEDVNRLEGVSDPITLRADCEGPTLPAALIPACGSNLTTDTDASTPGYQEKVVIANTSSDTDAATLEVFHVGNPTPVTTVSVPKDVNLRNTFNNVTFGGAGVYTFQACTTDLFNNTGCTPAGCQVTIGNLPMVSITAPDPSVTPILGEADDCDASTAGFQLQVTATTDQPDGALATVTVGANGNPQQTMASTTVAGGMVSVCMDAPQGANLPVTVAVTDPSSNLIGTDQVTVTIDSIAPTQAISDLALVSNSTLARGTKEFSWTAVPDGPGVLSSYIFKCAASAITNETDWQAATTFAFTPSVAPQAGGTPQQGTVNGFRPGTTWQCMLRGEDPAGNLTPLGNSVTVSESWRQLQLITPAGTTGSALLGASVAGVGDINGDGLPDMLVGGFGAAYLYFGRNPLPAGPVMPDVVITGTTSSVFGLQVAALGDISGDGRPDFAIAARGTNSGKGAIYVFFGRPSTQAWPATIDAVGSGCGANLCILHDDGLVDSMGNDIGADVGSSFGLDVAAAGDFDGDLIGDIVVGAPLANSSVGRAYVILGQNFDETAPPMTLRVPDNSMNAVQLNGFILDPPAGQDAEFGFQVESIGRSLGADADYDLAITATGSGAVRGSLYLIGGRSAGTGFVPIDMAAELGSTIFQEIRTTTTTGGYFGTALAYLGDVDGNGQADLALYNGDASSVGTTYVFPATATGWTSRMTITNDAVSPDNNNFGSVLAREMPGGSLGDLDRDGLHDVIAGSRSSGTAAGAPGISQLYYGRTPLPAAMNRSAADEEFDTNGTNPSFQSPAFVGDLNGDGAPDVAVGDRNYNSNLGEVIIFY